MPRFRPLDCVADKPKGTFVRGSNGETTGFSGRISVVLRHGGLLPLMMIIFALSQGIALAQGTLTNGATETGVIQVGGMDTWTFQATYNDSITLSIGEVLGNGSDPSFVPWIRLQNPVGSLVSSDSGNNNAQIDVRAPLTGTYTVLVASNTSFQVGPGSYILTLARTPGPYTVSPGHSGGPMIDGATETGVIQVGGLDTWTFQATYNDSITVSVGEVLGNGPDPNFVPWLRLRGPDGSWLDSYSGNNNAQIDVRAPLTGTYTVLVASNTSYQVGPGSYTLIVTGLTTPVCNSPAAFSLSSPMNDSQYASGTTTAILQWGTSNEADTYDVYFGTNPGPGLYQAGLTGTSLDVPVSSGQTYYWKLVSRVNCNAGYSQTAGPWSFSVNSPSQSGCAHGAGRGCAMPVSPGVPADTGGRLGPS